MARLANGLETMELGVTSWRIIINDNFTKVYSKSEIDQSLNSVNTAFNNALTEYEKTNDLNIKLADYAKKSDNTQNLVVNNIDMAGILKYTASSALPSEALPATPLGYIKAIVNGVNVKIPYYEE